MTNWKKLIGKRVLLRSWVPGRVEEAKILELSPSGQYIKIKWMPSELEEWFDIKQFESYYELVEVLDQTEEGSKNERGRETAQRIRRTRQRKRKT